MLLEFGIPVDHPVRGHGLAIEASESDLTRVVNLALDERDNLVDGEVEPACKHLQKVEQARGIVRSADDKHLRRYPASLELAVVVDMVLGFGDLVSVVFHLGIESPDLQHVVARRELYRPPSRRSGKESDLCCCCSIVPEVWGRSVHKDVENPANTTDALWKLL